VFSGAIAHNSDPLTEGEVVRVVSAKGDVLGVGHYQLGSIAVRMLSFRDQAIDAEFYRRRISAAYTMRIHLGLIRPDNNSFRLIHGEGDNLPGLIIDMYAGTAVVQAHSVGMHRDREMIVDALRRVIPEDNLRNIFINPKQLFLSMQMWTPRTNICTEERMWIMCRLKMD